MIDENEDVPGGVTEPEPEASVEDQARAALDQAIEADDDQDDAPEGDEPAAEPEPEAAEAEAEPEKDAKADVEAEVAELKLSERAGTRFREMAGEIKSFHESLESVGIKDVAELPQLVESARMGQEIVNDWASLNVTPEQYAGYLAYAQEVNAVAKGDRAAAESAFAKIEQEYTALAEFLGKDVAGADPLTKFPDLQEAVEEGDIDRKYALQLAATRVQEAARQNVQTQESQVTQQSQAIQQGEAELIHWDAQMRAADPTYAAKRDALSQQVAVIRESLPPEKWVAATQRLYAALPNIQQAPAPKPTPGPVRPGRTSAPMLRENASAREAIDFALNNG